MERIPGAQYYHARQACYLCLNPNDGVDTDIIIDYEGALFICKSCTRALALTAGWKVDEDRQPEIDKRDARIAELESYIADQEQLNAALVKDSHNHKKMAAVRAAKKVPA